MKYRNVLPYPQLACVAGTVYLYNGSLWRCLQSTSAVVPPLNVEPGTDTAFWEQHPIDCAHCAYVTGMQSNQGTVFTMCVLSELFSLESTGETLVGCEMYNPNFQPDDTLGVPIRVLASLKEVTYTVEDTTYQMGIDIPHVQAPSGDIPLTPMTESVKHAQNDVGYWGYLLQVMNQLTATQALNTKLQTRLINLEARVATLESIPPPEPEPVYDMAGGITLHTPALLGLLGIEIGGVDEIGSGWPAPSDGILVVDGATTIGLLTPIWIAINGVKADPSGTVVLQILGDGDNAEIAVRTGDIVTQSGMGNITFYRRIS